MHTFFIYIGKYDLHRISLIPNFDANLCLSGLGKQIRQ